MSLISKERPKVLEPGILVLCLLIITRMMTGIPFLSVLHCVVTGWELIFELIGKMFVPFVGDEDYACKASDKVPIRF